MAILSPALVRKAESPTLTPPGLEAVVDLCTAALNQSGWRMKVGDDLSVDIGFVDTDSPLVRAVLRSDYRDIGDPYLDLEGLSLPWNTPVARWARIKRTCVAYERAEESLQVIYAATDSPLAASWAQRAVMRGKDAHVRASHGYALGVAAVLYFDESLIHATYSGGHQLGTRSGVDSAAIAEHEAAAAEIFRILTETLVR